jgi:hypothetical protein
LAILLRPADADAHLPTERCISCKVRSLTAHAYTETTLNKYQSLQFVQTGRSIAMKMKRALTDMKTPCPLPVFVA